MADYLLAEVLERQPGEVRQLLLCTSILEQVNGALADALLGTSGAERVLHSLVQANAFIVPLDAAHSWFRYHHLFVDLLRLELRRTAPEVIPGLHRAAATWYAEHGYVIDAIRHAQAAEDWPYASRLLADHNFSLVLDGHEATIHTLLAAFPADAVSDPELARVFAGDQLVNGSLDNVAAFIDLAERHAGAVPDERLRRFQIALAVTRLSLARRRGDFSAALDEAQALIGPSSADTMSDVTLSNDARAFALKNLGIVELWSLRIDEAIHHLEQGLELGRQIGRPYIEVNCLAHLALAAGRHSFTQQLKHSLEAIEIAEAQGWATKPISCVPMAATGIAYLAQGRFAEGESWLDRAERAMSPEVDPATALLINLARGLQYICQGQFTQALTAFHAAEQCQTRLVTRHVLLILTRQFTVYTQLRLGDLAAARATIAELSDEEEQPWGELGAATAALHLADGDARAALDVLAPVLAGVAPMVLELTVVQAFILEAIARDRIGERQARDAAIERALDLAEQDGTLFAFALVPAQALLERHRLERTTHPVLVADILDMLTGASPPLRSGDPFELHEDLSEGELRVLRFLPSNLSAPEIAAELSLSTSTVKTHMRHIYSKLDVHRRTEAVERSRALGLLRSSTPPKR